MISITLFFVFAELFALGWYYVQTRQFFYGSQRPMLTISVEDTIAPSGDEPQVNEQTAQLMTTYRGHPFFAWIMKPSHKVNTHGFIFSEEYPIIKTNPNQYIIGVFGGSVGMLFSAGEGAKRLSQNLKQQPFFADKEIIIMNLALSSYKQPQQLLILNYYLAAGQQFDMVINIDGFNEVAFSRLNNQLGVDIAMPSMQSMTPILALIDQATLTKEKVETLANISRYKNEVNTFGQQMQDTPFAAVYFGLSQLQRVAFNQYNNEALKFNQLQTGDSMIYVYPTKNKLDDTALYEQTAALWINSSTSMYQLLQSKRIPYFHFLQPNQYHTQRVFSKDEAKIALNDHDLNREGVEKGYPVLVSKFGLLTQTGEHFYSALDIFDKDPNIVYQDSCCHYNDLGNRILADFIAKSIMDSGEFGK